MSPSTVEFAKYPGSENTDPSGTLTEPPISVRSTDARARLGASTVTSANPASSCFIVFFIGYRIDLLSRIAEW